MATELVKDGSKWAHNKEGYTIIVEHSAPHGNTLFRREVGLGITNTRKLRTKKTHYFLAEFSKYTNE